MKVRWWLVLVVVVAAAVAATLLGACGSGNASRPQVCATWRAPDGTWMEEDNEPVDGDPCDADGDDWEFDLDRSKPSVKKSPAKPVTDLGGRKKRF